MGKCSFIFHCVLAIFIVIEAKPWCGLDGCDSGEQDEVGRTDLLNEDDSSGSNEDEFENRYGSDGRRSTGYDPSGYGQGAYDHGEQGVYGPGVYMPGGHGQGIYGPGGYVPGEYGPDGHGQGIYYGPSEYVPGGYVSGGYISGGHGQGIHGPSGYDKNRGDEGFHINLPRRQYSPYNSKQGRFTVDIIFKNGYNGHSNGGFSGYGSGENISSGPCGVGSNGPCDERRPPHNNKKYGGTNYAFVPQDCPHCKIRTYGNGENNFNTFNLSKEAYD